MMYCLVHIRLLYAADYFLSLHDYFSFIIMLVCVSHSSISLLQYTVGWLEFNVPFQHKYGCIRDDIALHNNVTSPCILTVQANISRRSVYLHIMRLYSWYLHTVCTSKFLNTTFLGNVFLGNVFLGNVFLGNVFLGK